MTHKYKFSKYLLVLVFFSQTLFAFKKLPENFYINYEIFQSIKIRNVDIEKSQISSGEIKIKYKSKNKQYDLNVQIITKKFLKFYGDKEFQSSGEIGGSGLLFHTFLLKDIKKPKKNRHVTYDRKKGVVYMPSRNYQTREKKFVGNLLDIPSLIMQFQFEKPKPNYSFDFFYKKKIRNIVYKKMKDESIKINGNIYLAELYEGKILLAKNSKHLIWLSKGPYRIPIKIRLKMKGGLMIDQNLKTTDLKLKN
jgi:hypothetical protein